MRYLALGLIAVFSVALPSLGGFGALVTSERYIVTEDAVVSEDQYVTSVAAVVEGVIDGNLTIFSGDVTITGEVTGSVNAFRNPKTIVLLHLLFKPQVVTSSTCHRAERRNTKYRRVRRETGVDHLRH